MKIATGHVIKALRTHFDYTHEYVAFKTNISTRTLANIEHGRVALDLEKLYHFSLLFDLRPRVIIKLIIEVYEYPENIKQLERAIKELNPNIENNIIENR